MIKIGITGQAGFVGTHLYNTLNLFPEEYQVIPFQRDYFDNPGRLKKFVQACDAIVHLAGMNRHGDPQVIYDTNINLTKKLILACEESGATPHILFSSSTQEERDNMYGRSKKESRELFEKWADENDGQFSGLIIPNVYGPFGKPYYNSVVATFCHQLTHGETPRIETDGDMKLIYVGELVKSIIKVIRQTFEEHKNDVVINQILIRHSVELKVSALLNILRRFKNDYFERGEIPELNKPFHRNLFNTFLCYIDHRQFFPFHLKLNTDNRGSFVETVKLSSGGQVSFSTTVPGITRGNHFHTRKAERFAVIKGKARIEIRRIGTDHKLTFELDGSQPSFVDMPIWHTHNITNTGDEELYTIFWISEHFNPEDADTWFEDV